MWSFVSKCLLLLSIYTTSSEAKDFLFNCNNGSCIIKNAEIKAVDPEQLDFAFYTDASWYLTAKTIAFQNSSLHTVPSNIFSKMPNLTRIEARSSHIHQIEIHIFGEANAGNLANLQHLSLSWNKIFELQREQFAGARNLTELLLDWNDIEIINEKSLAGLEKLELLVLGHNLIKVFPGEFFHPLKALKKVILSHNLLEAFDTELFSKNNLTENLSLNDNKITTLEASEPTTMKYLQLSGNSLKELKYTNITSRFPQLQMLSLYKNPWNCSFLLKMVESLQDQGIRINALHYEGAKEATETNVKGIGCEFDKACDCPFVNLTALETPSNLTESDNNTAANLEVLSNNEKFQTALSAIDEDIRNLTRSLFHIESKMQTNGEKVTTLEAYVKQQDALLLTTIVMVADKVDQVLEKLKLFNTTTVAKKPQRERFRDEERTRKLTIFDQPRSWNRNPMQN